MDTALKTDAEKKEHFDSNQTIDKKVTELAKLIKASKHFIVSTGAGISTSAGIPDYRSGINTAIPTGPGAWEKAAQGVVSSKKRVKMTSVFPTPSHMALVKLLEVGYLKFLISQNVDGLHRKSGIPASHIAEVHGNTNLEICGNEKCKKRYMRDFRVSARSRDHKTGRKCEICGGDLLDSIIEFGEDLRERELDCGYDESSKADLCLILGTSMRVGPAAEMPLWTTENGGRLFIVNLQATPLDSEATRINGFIDKVMIRLMEKLGLEIPSWTLKRRIMIKKIGGTEKGLKIRGIDEEGSPYTLFKSLRVTFSTTNETILYQDESSRICPKNSSLDTGLLNIQLEFYGHYNEPVFDLEIDLASLELNVPVYRLLDYDPMKMQWISCKEIEIK